MQRGVFLDRDGVINRAIVKDGKPYAPVSQSEFVLLPGVVDALFRLKGAGFIIVIVTNQPDIATGKQQINDLKALHAALLTSLPIDLIQVCPHSKYDNCECRKPKTKLLLDAAHEFDIDMQSSFMVGDRWSDIVCGQTINCKQNYFIDYGYKEPQPARPYVSVTSLAQAVELILQQ
jgi:D-glycero-D-manno-heptose 1,7-bisphosphate phosphatase